MHQLLMLGIILLQSKDRADLTDRVFALKLKALREDLLKHGVLVELNIREFASRLIAHSGMCRVHGPCGGVCVRD